MIQSKVSGTSMKIDEGPLKEARILLHPMRYRIAELLAEKPMHIRELIEALGEDRRLVSYHLLTLEEHGFISSEFDLPQETITTRQTDNKRYSVTGKSRISCQFLILEAEGLLGDSRTTRELHAAGKLQDLKGKVTRKYSATEKAEGVLSELKKYF